MKLRDFFARFTLFRVGRATVRTLVEQFGFGFHWIGGLFRLMGFWREYRVFRRLNLGSHFALQADDVMPYLIDRTSTTPVEPTYFFQDTWFARKIAEKLPSAHVDVGSSAKSMALIAQFVPVTFVDIRPIEIQVENFTFLKGSILALPFGDGTLASLSSLCVIEHIGLGRYGDPLDMLGSEKAAAELLRVLAPGGNLYVTVPVDSECRIYFNAHRAFTPDYVFSLFPGLTLLEEKYIYGMTLMSVYLPDRGFGTGLYHFRRP